ncbi:MAG: alpha/beta hydrolase [Bacteroidota bacterium]
MKHITSFFTLLLAVNLIWGQETTERLTIQTDTFTSQSGVSVIGEVGSFKVKENRANADSRWISVEFIRLKSISTLRGISGPPNSGPAPLLPPLNAPLIYLEGGPGSACTWQASNDYYLEGWLPFLQDRDVILFDQRCSSRDANQSVFIWQEGMPENALVDGQVMKDLYRKVGQEALKAYEERGIDLAGYTTKENAIDIEELRQALGLEKLNLLGFSYGTHLGQAYIRYFGEHVENAVLVGAEGSNHNYKLPSSIDMQLHKLSLMVGSDANLSKDVPDLVGLYKRVSQKLDVEPAEIEIINALTQKPMKLKIGSFGLQGLLRYDIGDASDLPVFPRLLYSIDQGDYSLLTWFAQKRFPAFGIHGIATTMDLASGASTARRARIAAEEPRSLFPGIVNFPLDACEDFWPIPDLGEAYRSPLISDVRTLFMSGTLDFNTPPYQAEEIRWGFSNSSHIIVDNAGHEQILAHPDASQTVQKFLKGENVDDVALFYPKLRFIPVRGEREGLYHPSMGEK